MIELNFGPIGYFGPDEYIVYGPGPLQKHIKERPDRTIKIPEKGRLETLPHCILEDLLDSREDRAYLCDLEPAKPGGTFTAVRLQLQFDEIPSFREHIIMPWIKQRGEWVVLVYQGENYDEDYLGPFELNRYCQRKILEAYHILEGNIPLKDIPSTSPEQLRKISDRIQG